MGAKQGSTSGSTPGGPAGGGSADGDRRIGRRALIVGGAAAAVGTGVLARDELSRLWWRIPGVERPREDGVVDYAGARWVAASDANWRRADRPDDFGIDMVIVHVTQGSFDSAVRAFQDPGHKAAAHYIVGQDGRVTQMIRELDVAYHAGNRDYNERSVGVPFFVLDRAYGVSGAQPAEVFTQALTQAWGERTPLKLIDDGGAEACGPDGCAVPGH